MCIFHDYTRWGIPEDAYNGHIKQARVYKDCGKVQVRNLGYLDGLYAEGIKKSLERDIYYCKERLMDIDEKEMMREDMLRDQLHERMMRTDIEYFCEHTVEDLYIIPEVTRGIHLFDIIDALRQECSKYDQDLDDLLDYMKGV